MRKKLVLSLALVLTLVSAQSLALTQRRATRKAVAATSAPALAAEALRAAEQITAAQLRDYLTFIASDEMEGRDTPSRGLDTTAKFLALQLARAGAKPAGDDGTYFQRIKLRRVKVDPEKTRVELDGQRFNYGDDFLAGNVSGTTSGNLVYVGHGWVFPAKNINPYAGIDVRDRIMVVASGLPRGVTFNDLLSGKQGQDWESPDSYGKKNGARGIVFIPSFQELATWNRRRQSAIERGITYVERFQTGNPDQLPSITASFSLLNALFRGEKVSASDLFARLAAGEDGEPFALSPDKTLTMSVDVASETVYTQNVVATVEGSDPVLKNEYVALGAHYDHVGIGLPDKNGDRIYNGADDDGSGTTALLAIAEAFARSNPRPKRSILFVWHAGEEKGLWGSRYFTQFPTVPLDRIIAQLNIDMIGRSKRDGDAKPENRDLSGPNEIYVIGSRMMSTELGELSERVNKSYLNLAFNYKYDDPKDPNRFFFRSDHYNYAQKGIPIIFYFDGVHEDYHRPSDSPDKIDYQKMERVARTIFMTAWELANLPQRPRVDRELPAELRGAR
ncbi:M20/M25/M40 family metallo-hydrolase [Pyrinomonas methylaliphatogenes]|uniref:Predicted aminopeptidase n=1 Tax=Pyrinomonas methylaliphatogenes TaxID=454194 RepID=A0A0B6X1H1_9BACT|nr:M20/M25/M40 family metallo-hydrolase [Pyrinomonas methylaliphatogenes]CDM67141.1 predicted aminopeptidase [Pyrinomonas methylaliphatogenes]